MSSSSIAKLTDEQAQDRTNWLMNVAGREFWHAVKVDGDELYLDEDGIDKLREIARVARQVAKHFEDKLPTTM